MFGQRKAITYSQILANSCNLTFLSCISDNLGTRRDNEYPSPDFDYKCKLRLNKYQVNHFIIKPVSEFKEFEPRLKSAKNRFQLSAVLNLEKIEYNFKWNQPKLSRSLNLNRGLNSLNSASG